MIVFGFAFDTDDLARAERRVMEGSSHLWHTCYSTGGGNQSAAVFGVEIDHSSFLFNPVPLSSLTTQPTAEQREMLSHRWAEVPELIKSKSKDKEPQVYVFDDNDD